MISEFNAVKNISIRQVINMSSFVECERGVNDPYLFKQPDSLILLYMCIGLNEY